MVWMNCLVDTLTTATYHRWKRGLKKLPSYLGATLIMLADQVVSVGFKGCNYLQSLRVNLKQALPLIAFVFDLKLRRKLLSNAKKGFL